MSLTLNSSLSSAQLNQVGGERGTAGLGSGRASFGVGPQRALPKHICDSNSFTQTSSARHAPSPHVPTVIVCVHLPEDLVCPFLRRGLVFGHLHHGGHHLVDGLQRSIQECAQECGGWAQTGQSAPSLRPDPSPIRTNLGDKMLGKESRKS